MAATSTTSPTAQHGLAEHRQEAPRSAVSLKPAVSHVLASAMCSIWLGCLRWARSPSRRALASAEARLGNVVDRVARLVGPPVHAAREHVGPRAPKGAQARRRRCLSWFPQRATLAWGLRCKEG